MGVWVHALGAMKHLLIVLVLVACAFAAGPFSYPCPRDGGAASLEGCRSTGVVGYEQCTYSHLYTQGGYPFVTHRFMVTVATGN